MHRPSSLTALAIVIASVVVAACSQQAGPAPTANPISALPTTAAGVQPTAGMISSGASSLPTTVTPPERPTAVAGVRRALHINEALRIVPFKMLEPKQLNAEYHLDATQIYENRPNENDPSLPRVRMIYQGDQGGVIILTEGPATGEPIPGETIDIGAVKGGYTADPGPTLTWEQAGLRIEMRGRDVTKEFLLAAAQSMEPFGDVAN